jgi:hypothetical protein
LRSVPEPHDMHTSLFLTEAGWFAMWGSFNWQLTSYLINFGVSQLPCGNQACQDMASN